MSRSPACVAGGVASSVTVANEAAHCYWAVFAVFHVQRRQLGTGDPRGQNADHAAEGSHELVSVPWNEPVCSAKESKAS